MECGGRRRLAQSQPAGLAVYCGGAGQVTTLAAHARLDNPQKVADLLRALSYVGAAGQLTTLLDRDPAAHASLDLSSRLPSRLSLHHLGLPWGGVV